MNNILFYSEIFLLFIIFSEFQFKENLNPLVGKAIKAIAFTFAVFVIHKLNTDSKDNFFFQLTPEKACPSPYMRSSDPERQKYCNQFTQQQDNDYQCTGGFIGRPIASKNYVSYIPGQNNIPQKAPVLQNRVHPVNNQYIGRA